MSLKTFFQDRKNKQIATLFLLVFPGEVLRRLIFSSGLSTQLFNGNNFSCRLTACHELLLSNGWMGDDGWYLTIANQLTHFRWLTDDQLWIVRLWPPGMGFIYTVLHVVSLNQIGLYAMLAVTSWILWMIIVTRVALQAPHLLSRALIITLFSLLFSTKSGREWMFGPAISYSETLSIGFFCLFLIQLSSRSTRSWRPGIFAGCFLALAVYTRSVFDFFAIGLFVATFSFVGFSVLKNLSQLLSKSQLARPLLSHFSRRMISVAVTVIALTFPWRLYLKSSVTHSYSFNGNGGVIWINGWIPTEMHIAQGNQYFLDIGINGFCQAYPRRCTEIANIERKSENPYSGSGAYSQSEFRKFAINSIKRNPRPWFSQRIFFLKNATRDAVSHSFIGSLGLWFPIFLGASSFVMLSHLYIRKRLNVYLLTQFVCVLSTGVLSIGPLFFASFEPRYVFPFLYSLVVLAGLSIAAYVPLLSSQRRPRRVDNGVNDCNRTLG